MQLQEDHHLLSQVALGDRQAFEALYARYASRIRSYIRSRLIDIESCDEVLNDVMLVIWQNAKACPSQVPLLAWLYGVARKKILESLRRQGRSTDETYFAWISEVESPEIQVLMQDRQQVLARAISRLPQHERQPVELLVYHGHSYHDIAVRLATPVNTIKSRVLRARARLAAAVSS